MHLCILRANQRLYPTKPIYRHPKDHNSLNSPVHPIRRQRRMQVYKPHGFQFNLPRLHPRTNLHHPKSPCLDVFRFRGLKRLHGDRLNVPLLFVRASTNDLRLSVLARNRLEGRRRRRVKAKPGSAWMIRWRLEVALICRVTRCVFFLIFCCFDHISVPYFTLIYVTISSSISVLFRSFNLNVGNGLHVC